ncbi:MAG: glycoside hydrolase family 3 protein [Gemmatimonadaceae bacterium]
MNVAVGTPLGAAQQRWVDSTLATLSLREQVGQMVMMWILGDYTNVHDASYEQIVQWVTEDRIGGVSMSLGSPIEVAVKLNDLQELVTVPLLVSADLEPSLGRLEGGVFLPYMLTGGSATVIPSNMAIGATGDTTLAYRAGAVIGREARALGIHLAFAPTVDVNSNPANPVINTRSFGEDPYAVARLSAAFVRGVQDQGVAATPKHFPGHGDTDTDSHNALPVVTSDRARLDSVELVPFEAAIAAGAATIMTAHIALPAVDPDSTPATLAPVIVTDLLRDSLGFEGVAVTDALTMEAVGEGYPVERSTVLAVKAGADILLKPSDIPRAIDAVVAAVESGEIARERIERSVRRVLELKARSGAAARPTVSLDVLRRIVGAPEHWAVAHEIAERAITLVRDSAGLVPVAGAHDAFVVIYASDTDLEAGRTFIAELGTLGLRVRSERIGPETFAARLNSLALAARDADRIIIATNVRRFQGEGRNAIAPQVASWIDALAADAPVIVVANGNPYVIAQFPNVDTYITTYGIGESLERAAARALAGAAPIGGRTPISLPGYFELSDGIQLTGGNELSKGR